MSMTTEELRSAYLRSGDVCACSEKVGRIRQIYLDDETSQPPWVTVKTSLFGTSESFVPLNQARLEGSDIIVEYDEDTIKKAPRIDADRDLTPREELALFRYYCQPQDTDTADRGDRVDRDEDRLDRDDDSRTRYTAEDHQRVVDEIPDRGDESQSGRAPLRRYMVTEITEDR